MKSLKIFFCLVLSFFLFRMGMAASFRTPSLLIHQNATTRQFVRTLKIQHKIHFLEGFFSSTPFVCDETFYFEKPGRFRMDYLCDGILLSVLEVNQQRKLFYHGSVIELESRPMSYWPALFLSADENHLIESLSYFNFILAKPLENKIDLPDKWHEPIPNKSWVLEGQLKLSRLGLIQKSDPHTLERNKVSQLVSPVADHHEVWLDHDLFLPIKITFEDKDIVFKNYQNLSQLQTIPYAYPSTIEIQKEGLSGVVIDTLPEFFGLNTPFEGKIFSQAQLRNQTQKGFPESLSYIKEILERFILEFR